MDAPSLFDLVRTLTKLSVAVRGRLDQLEALVRLALIDLGVTDPDAQLVQERTWQLLSRIVVLMPRLETPDEAGCAAVTNALIPSRAVLTSTVRRGCAIGSSRWRMSSNRRCTELEVPHANVSAWPSVLQAPGRVRGSTAYAG